MTTHTFRVHPTKARTAPASVQARDIFDAVGQVGELLLANTKRPLGVVYTTDVTYRPAGATVRVLNTNKRVVCAAAIVTPRALRDD